MVVKLLAYIALLLLMTFLVAMYTLYKVRRMHIMLYQMFYQIKEQSSLDNIFRQLEALQGLYRDMGLKRSLPPTRGWAASPDFLHGIARHALAEKPRMVVECGSGTSTIVLARCMQLNRAGKVYSLEHDPEFARQTRRYIEEHGLTEWAVVLDAPLCSHHIGNESWIWYREASLPEAGIEMLVVDGPPMTVGKLARYPAAPVLFPRLSEDAAVFLDDAARKQEKAVLMRWCMEFPEFTPKGLDYEKGCAVLRKGSYTDR